MVSNNPYHRRSTIALWSQLSAPQTSSIRLLEHLFTNSSKMPKARTCSGRVQLHREANKNLIVLKEELINPQVVDLAVKFHRILAKSLSKYTNNAIVVLIPEITIQ